MYLASTRPDIVGNNDYSLRFSSLHGYLDVVEYLIEHGADVNATGDKANIDSLGDDALTHASECGHLDIVKYLIKHGANVNNNALRSASENGHSDIVEYLIANRSN